jgi:HlyD family secretion protein
MDRELAPELRRRRRIRRIATIAVAAAAVMFSFAATVSWLRPSIRRRDIQTARVERGPVAASLQASGTVVPAVETVIASPIEARVLRINRRAGDTLRRGDEILTLDISATRLDAERLSDAVAQRQSELAKLQLQVEEGLATIRSQIEQKKLDGQILRYAADRDAKLHAAGLVAAQQDLASATAAKKNELEIAQLRDALDRARRSGDAQIDAATAAVRTARNERDQSMRQVQLAMTGSDRDGVLTWVVPEAGAMVRKGDVIARVADLSTFRVAATIADTHASKLSPGGEVRVRLDDTTFIQGVISSVEPRMENGVAKFYVDLREPSHPRLRNQLRADVFVMTQRSANTLRVRRGSLGDTDFLFVIHGRTATRTPVRFGLTGEDYVEVHGVREGDEVIISSMTDYSDTKQLQIK